LTNTRPFNNGVLRRIFVPKMDEVTGEWRKLHNEELHSLYSSHVKAIEVGGACGTHGRGENIVQGFGGKMGSEWMLGRLAWGVWFGFDWLRTETGGGLL
jgi:hypothetical protein